MPSSGSCSRCYRPLAADAVGDVCEVCLRTGDSPGSTPASARPAGVETTVSRAAAPPQRVPAGTLSPAAPPAPAGGLSTPPTVGLTRSRVPDGDTKGFTIVVGQPHRPEPPPGYDLIRPLGAGGWGAVYLAREQAAERTVAIKFLHAPSSRQAFDRFLVEARALARLDHPNIIKVITVDTNWREPFLTMEFAAGGTLADLVAPGCPLPPPAKAARLVLGAADAIAAAHAENILHRDLKPSNILLASGQGRETGDGEDRGVAPAPPSPSSGLLTPKVSDFGLAKRTDRDEDLTRTGPLGTPCYMSPEAAAGRFREVGPASDVYGLGATLYYLVTGRPPFQADSTDEIIRRVQNDAPDRPRALRPEVPAGLEAIVVKAMEKDPAARYPTAAALADDLRRFLAGQMPAAPVLSPRRRAGRWLARNRRRTAAAGLVVLLAAGLVAVGLAVAPRRPAGPTPAADPLDPIRADLAAGKAVTLVGETGQPKWHQWRLMPSTLAESPANDHSASFQTNGTTLLELLPDPVVDRYRVTADIRHLDGDPPPPGGQVSMSYVGFYFGYAAEPTGEWLINTLYAARYTDFAPGDGRGLKVRPAVQLGEGVFPQHPGRLPSTSWRGTGGLSFTPRPDRMWPGEWRQLVVDVTPDRVLVRWRGAPGGDLEPVSDELTGDQVRARYADLATEIRWYARGSDLVPRWRPGMPFGIIADHSTVSFRNVTIEPLP